MKIFRYWSVFKPTRWRAEADLIDTTELEVNVQVLLVERLQTRVEHTRHERALRLLDDICTSVLGGFDRSQRVESAVSAATPGWVTLTDLYMSKVYSAESW